MAVPKRRMSRSRSRSRRSQGKATPPTLVPVVIGGRRRLLPPRLLPYFRRFPERLPD